MSILNRSVSSVERELQTHGSQIRGNGREYDTLQAVECCRKAAYRAFLTPSNNTNPIAHFLASLNDLNEHILRDMNDSDMVGITIQNEVNQNDKPNKITFRRKDQIAADVIWSVFVKYS